MRSSINLVIAAFATFVSLGAQAESPIEATRDCVAPSIRFRKSADLDSRLWACAAASGVPFAERDTNEVVAKCLRESVLYKELGFSNGKTQYCAKLVRSNLKQTDFLHVKQSAEGNFVPNYQASVYTDEESQHQAP